MNCVGLVGAEGGDAGGGGGGGAVKYAVAGALGALSLVVARRWAGAGPAAQLAPTGVSRRRRLAAARDPGLRRPPPRVPPPVPPPPPARRKPARPSAAQQPNSDFPKCSFPNSNSNQTFGYDSPAPPKHMPFPNIPREDNLIFEFMMFIFTALASGAQFLNLYRTVWWLPHSFTSQTMNFYLIDCHLVLFILIMLGRRLLLSACSAVVKAVTPTRILPIVLQMLNFFVLSVIIGGLCCCLYHLFPKHPILSIFFLCYPISVYFLLFGMHAGPFLQLESPVICAPHCCANGPAAIRNEVELLKVDFNYRLKQIIFSSLVGAYYASFVPWCFAQHFLHYDVYRIIRHLGLVWFGLFIQHATHSLSARYCDQLHRAALHLGRWDRKGSATSINLTQTNPISGSGNSAGFPIGGAAPIGPWCHKTLWAAGSSVRHGRWTYVSAGCVTAAEPGNLMHFRFYSLFNNPSSMICTLLCLQFALVLLLFVLLVYTTEWHFVLSIALLLISNYYTLFKLVRDYLVTWKVYQTESSIQDKNVFSS